jgi:ATP-dependent protease HslVU (ClpYQ) peptidase subunit
VTTIAVKDGVMASDSRITEPDGMVFGRVPKIYRLASRALLGHSGDADIRDALALLNTCTVKKLPTRAELSALKLDFAALLLFPNGKMFAVSCGPRGEVASDSWYGEVIAVSERYAAVGSGAKFAIGAMAAGRSAKQAVEIACRYDTASGPPVTEHRVK